MLFRSLIRAPVQPHQPLTVTDSAARAALGSVVPNNGQLSGVSRPPDTPIGSTARYEVRAHGPAAPSIAREDFSADDPIAPLAATAGEIRRAAARRARRRSLASLGVVIGVSLVIAGAATAIILFIARM